MKHTTYHKLFIKVTSNILKKVCKDVIIIEHSETGSV